MGVPPVILVHHGRDARATATEDLAFALPALSYVPGVGDGAGAVSVAAGDGVATGEPSGLGEGEGLAFAVLRFVLA